MESVSFGDFDAWLTTTISSRNRKPGFHITSEKLFLKLQYLINFIILILVSSIGFWKNSNAIVEFVREREDFRVVGHSVRDHESVA